MANTLQKNFPFDGTYFPTLKLIGNKGFKWNQIHELITEQGTSSKATTHKRLKMLLTHGYVIEEEGKYYITRKVNVMGEYLIEEMEEEIKRQKKFLEQIKDFTDN